MKRMLPIILVVAAILTSCEYHYEERIPHADFSVDYDLIVPREVVSFTNYSEDAIQFEWNFGDGNYSTQRNPSHYYKFEGNYEVSLAAINGRNIEYAYMTISVYETTLEIQVVDWETDELVPRANVVLYPSKYDYDNFEQEIFVGASDYNGSVIVKGLNTQSYYIDVYNNYFNNFTLAIDDLGFVRTLPLEHAAHNIFIAYVDYDPASFKSAGEKIKVRSVKISSEKRTLKDKQEKSQI